MSLPIQVTGLSKSFGAVSALDGLDLTVDRGEIAAFLGPNGAGKSTTIRILLGLLRADTGEVRVLDGHPWRDAVALHRRLAYVPGDVSLWPNLTGGETIDVLTRLRGGGTRVPRAELVDRFELDPTKKGRSYSKGNRQKVALVAALAADAELYVLDEPTAGLDPLMEAAFQETLHDLRAEGRTVLLSSHILAEVEKACDTVTIVRGGRTVLAGRLDELRELRRSRITAQTRRPVDGLARLPGVHDLQAHGDGVSFTLDTTHTAEVMRALAELELVRVISSPPSLEELFLHEYRQEQGTADAPRRPR